jgi:hypothetical protein
MKKLGLILLAVALSAGGGSALALDAGIGGVGVSAGSGTSGGMSGTASAGNTSASVSIGDGSVASAGVGFGQSQVTGTVSSTGAQPGLSITQGENSTDAAGTLGLSSLGLDGTADGAVGVGAGTLGALLSGIDIGPASATPGSIAPQFASLSQSQQRVLLDRCVRVLMNPGAFDRNVILLCRKLASL